MSDMDNITSITSAGNAFDERQFRNILGQFATGVTIVTMLDPDNRLSGFTASSFSSVSIDPPLVLICVDYATRCYEHLRLQQAFTIHILDGDQEDAARAFALPGQDRSDACEWHVNKRGFPMLSRFHAALECRLFREYEGGDHAIIVGRVEHVHAESDDGTPLLCYKSQMFPLSHERERRQ